MKKIFFLFILFAMSIKSIYSQVEVKLDQIRTSDKEYFQVSIKNTSDMTLVFKNLKNQMDERNASWINFMVYNSGSSELNSTNWILSKGAFFTIEPGITKVNVFSKKAILGYITYPVTPCSFKAIIHLYFMNFSRQKNGEASLSVFKSFEMEKTFHF